MEIRQIVIKIPFDGLSYCEYSSRISGLIVPKLGDFTKKYFCKGLGHQYHNMVSR